ncbi:DEAD/DEAH box helicase [Mangrovimicrobium sediminis]|uniref:DEAD/DEAH box helicase n=1 Tax=Mangrovimicrobium sediminis TaxID=2562682 RepID=A0A4Z0LY31_9GAMM|nr:DEAD/DEAH box helicase [Haliea sp. SAOS-164]TGD72057.1 DEAD/DEAH box helicase [Haliea sp. SAOS-164]
MLDELDLDRGLRLGLDALELEAPTPVQAQVIPAALAGADLRVSAQTGSGKTLAYLLPTLQRILAAPPARDAGAAAVVLVPTRELARQVLRSCRELIAKTSLSAQGITGGADFKYQKSLLRKNPEIIVATPGRLLEHCEKGSADLAAVRTLVLDEADRMLDMGFREEVLKVAAFCPAQRQVILLSATLNHAGLGSVADTLLHDAVSVAIDPPRTAGSGIRHQRILADSPEHKDALLKALCERETAGRALVFANQRTTAQRLGATLAEAGLRSDCLHGEMSTEERKAVMHRFHNGQIQVLCASDLAARGLDVPGIELVVNYDLPRSGDDYLHRVGRTGRAGAEGLAVSLVAPRDWNLMISIQRYLGLEFEAVAIDGLKARYQGPKRLKSSGKAAGSKKKKTTKAATKAKLRARERKNKGKRRTPTGVSSDGFAPLTRPPRDK